MTEREMLELAAKAAGHTVKGQREDADGNFTHLLVNSGHGTRTFAWNPRQDDGDALRLAVKLRLHIEHYDDGVHVWVIYGDAQEFREHVLAAEATRRAIVRAAAEIGKAMP